MDTIELIINLIGMTLYTPVFALVLYLLGVLVKYQIIRRLMVKFGAKDTMVQKAFKIFDICAIVVIAVPSSVIAYIAYKLWYMPLILLVEFLLSLWLLSRMTEDDSPTMDPDPDPSLLPAATMLYLATRSRSQKKEPASDWIEEDERLDYAALDEDFKEEVEEFFDRDDYDY